jgi:hypothetical protein
VLLLTYFERYKLPEPARDSDLFFTHSDPLVPRLSEQTLNLFKLGTLQHNLKVTSQNCVIVNHKLILFGGNPCLKTNTMEIFDLRGQKCLQTDKNSTVHDLGFQEGD